MVIHFAHNRGNGIQASQLSGTPAPFTGNQFKASGTTTQQDWLYQALSGNGVCQFLQGLRIKVNPWLVSATTDRIDRHIADLRVLVGVLVRSGEYLLYLFTG